MLCALPVEGRLRSQPDASLVLAPGNAVRMLVHGSTKLVSGVDRQPALANADGRAGGRRDAGSGDEAIIIRAGASYPRIDLVNHANAFRLGEKMLLVAHHNPRNSAGLATLATLAAAVAKLRDLSMSFIEKTLENQ